MSWFFSRTSSSSSVTHTQLFCSSNTVTQTVATTTITESKQRHNCINISTAGCDVGAQMSAHSGQEVFLGSLFLPHRKLCVSWAFQRGTSDVTSDGGAAACCPVCKPHSCRSGLFSLGQSHQSIFRVDRTKRALNKQTKNTEIDSRGWILISIYTLEQYPFKSG